MRYKLLGRSGLRVSELCLGGMTFGEDWGWGASKVESRKVFDAFANAGGNFVDTSNNYTNGSSEKYVGEFIAAERERFVVATKYTLTANAADPNAGGNQRKNMMQAVEASLRRLNTDYIDLYYLHMWDYTTPVEEVMRAFDDLVRSGKVLYAGLSDTPAWIVSQAETIAALRGWPHVVAVQGSYSLAHRVLERDILPMAQALDMAVLAWGVLEEGELTGKYNSGSSEPKRNTSASPKNMELVKSLMAVAQDAGRTPAQIAINWVRRHSGRAPVIPIIAARTEAQIRDNLAAVEFELTPGQIQQLNVASPIDLGFPASFLASDHVHGLIFGSTFNAIDNHHR